MESTLTNNITPISLAETPRDFTHKNQHLVSVPTVRLDGKPLKEGIKRRKKLPASISEHDRKILIKVKNSAYCLDMGLFSCCGIRFGWSSAIGIVPGIGDIIDMILAIITIWNCQRIEGGLPSDVIMKMYINIIFDFILGLVPLIGDIADALFRANMRNATILEHHLSNKFSGEELGKKYFGYRG